MNTTMTMTVTVRARPLESWGTNRVWAPVTVTVTIPTLCRTCGAPRGEPRGLNQHDDGDWYWVQVWDNSCGHTDHYEAVLVEALEYAGFADQRDVLGAALAAGTTVAAPDQPYLRDLFAQIQAGTAEATPACPKPGCRGACAAFTRPGRLYRVCPDCEHLALAAAGCDHCWGSWRHLQTAEPDMAGLITALFDASETAYLMHTNT